MGILATWGYNVLVLEVQQSLQFIEVCATMVCVRVCHTQNLKFPLDFARGDLEYLNSVDLTLDKCGFQAETAKSDYTQKSTHIKVHAVGNDLVQLSRENVTRK